MNKEKQISLFVRQALGEGVDFIAEMQKMTRKSYNSAGDLRQDVLFSKQDVLEYIHRYRLEKKILGAGGQYSTVAGSADGRYLVKESDGYTLYDQERGARRDERNFGTEAEALSYLEGGSRPDDRALERWVDTHLSVYL